VHELSITRAIAEVVVEHARGRRVEAVGVRVGALRQIVPDSLDFCWDIVRRRPGLEDARLDIERVPGIVHCTCCDQRSTLTEFTLRCPACGDGLVRVVQGEECLVTWLDIADAAADDDAADDVAPDDAARAAGVIATEERAI
jgi:hydrogenase nickel incorporation protein HypA/HybF